MKKAVVCDLDETLVRYPLVRLISKEPLRMMVLGLMTISPLFLQKKLSSPTSVVPEIKELQEKETQVFVVSSRRKRPVNLKNVKTLLGKIGLEIPQERIYLRQSQTTRPEHKIKAVREISKNFTIKAVIEDEINIKNRLRNKFNITVLHPNQIKQIQALF